MKGIREPKPKPIHRMPESNSGRSGSPLEVIKGSFGRMEKHHVIILLIILAASFTLRAWALPDSSLTTDEAEKMEAVDSYGNGEFWVDLEHPPVEKYLIFLSTSLFGDEEWAIKLPNVVLGSLIPLAAFMVAARIGKGPWPGILASAIAALSPLLIGYSLIAKEDTPVALLSLLTSLFLISLLDREEVQVSEINDRRSFWRLDPRSLDSLELCTAVMMGIALATKFTFLLILITWALYAFMTRRELLKRRGPPIGAAALLVFLLLSWYYLNPYWLILGLGHWLWEAGTGHSTYFLGSIYDFPPPYFYIVSMIGRIHPLVWAGSLAMAGAAIYRLFKGNEQDESERAPFRESLKKDNGIHLMLAWTLGCLLLMTLIPFKGIRYVQWVLPPMIVLSALFLWKLMSWIREDVAGPISLLSICILLGSTTFIAYPYYQEMVYFYDADSGMKDLSGQGFRETFEWMEDNGLEGKVALRWTKLGSYYWDNVTDPVGSKEEAEEERVSYMLLYLADVQRGKHPEMTDLALSDQSTLIFKVRHDEDTILWLYRFDLTAKTLSR